jgi:hypothetical protein
MNEQRTKPKLRKAVIVMSDQLMHYRERAATALSAFMARALQGDAERAMKAARQAIDGYSPRTPREVQLSAQIVACGFAALACLRSAVAAKDLPVKTVLRLQNNAVQLDKHAAVCTKALEEKQRERQRAPQILTNDAVAWDAASFETTIGVAMANMLEADSHIADILTQMVPMFPKGQAKATKPEAAPAAKPEPATKLKFTMGMPMTADVLDFRAGRPVTKSERKRGRAN